MKNYLYFHRNLCELFVRWKKKYSVTGSRTQLKCVKGTYTNRYTITEERFLYAVFQSVLVFKLNL